MAGVLDTHRTEVDSENIESGVGAALEDTRQTAYEGVGTVGRHGVDHHASGTTAGKGLHQGRGHGVDPLGVHARQRYGVVQPANEQVHGTGGTENADSNENCHQIGNDAHGSGKAVLGSLDESVVDVDPLTHGGHDETGDNAHQQDVGCGSAHTVHHVGRQLREAPYDAGHQQTGTTEGEQHDAVEQVDALVERRDDNTGQRREERGQEDGDEYVGRLGRSHLCAIDHDADRNEREARRVEHEEHNHGVGGRVLLGVQLLHLLHGLQSERSSGIVEAEHVGGYVHEDAARDGMALGYVGKQTGEDGRQQAGQHIDHSALLADSHHAEPQRQYASES